MNNGLSGSPFSSLNGLRVILDETMVIKKWQFPERRFVEWEHKDEGWARRLGFGREVILPDMSIRVEGDKAFVHPQTFEELKRVIERRNAANESVMSAESDEWRRFKYLKGLWK